MEAGLSVDQEAELREQKEAISKLMAKKSLNRSRSPVKEKYANLRNGSANNLFDVSNGNQEKNRSNGGDAYGEIQKPEDDLQSSATDESGSIESIPVSLESIQKPGIMTHDISSEIDMAQVESADATSASEPDDNDNEDLLDVSDTDGIKCRNPTPALEGEMNIIDSVLKQNNAEAMQAMEEAIQENEIGETNIDEKEIFNASLISSDQESFETVKVVEDQTNDFTNKPTFHSEDPQTPDVETPAQLNNRNQIYTLPSVLGYQAENKKSPNTLKQKSDLSESEDEEEIFKKHCKCDVIKKDPKMKTKVCNII
uniref:Uncharacterized protein n=1 Tax=Acrobeloides nanus TaxID=290746 RepID=A0A914DWR3_9BILA